MALASGVIDCGVAARPMPGQTESGDRHVVADVHDGALVAVMDALGHGPEAKEAAQIAADTVETYAREPATVLFQRCHERLARTRGVVMSVGTFHRRGTLTWLGLGNVDGVLVHPQPDGAGRCDWLLVRSGVLGARLPLLRPSIVRVAHADTLYMATDGVRLDAADLGSRDRPQRIADGILHRHAIENDDALVLVARYVADR